jgi:hypothetical protein
MENEKIKSPLTNRPIYIGGDAYKKLITKSGYTQDYLLSLPRITVEKPLSPKVKSTKKIKSLNSKPPSLNKDILFEIALNSKYFTILNLCQTNKNYNQHICHNEQFWELKYKRDFTNYNKERYLKQADFWKKWFPKDFRTFEEYNEEKFLDAGSWKVLYEDDFYNLIEAITLSIFYRFGIQEKYDDRYEDRKRKITLKIINYIKQKSISKNNNLDNKIVKDISKIIGDDYEDFNYYSTFFNKSIPDNDTPEEFLLKMVKQNL